MELLISLIWKEIAGYRVVRWRKRARAVECEECTCKGEDEGGEEKGEGISKGISRRGQKLSEKSCLVGRNITRTRHPSSPGRCADWRASRSQSHDKVPAYCLRYQYRGL